MREQRSITEHIDWPLFLVYLVMVLMGWFNIYAAVYDPAHESIFSMSMQYGKQIQWIGISLGVAMLILFADAKLFAGLAYFIYGAFILLLIATLFVGTEIKGSHSWIRIGGFSLQPAELSKFAVALGLAKYLGDINTKLDKTRSQLIAAGIVLVPMAIIVAQSETGQALVYASFILAMYREGLPSMYLTAAFGVLVVAILALLFNPLYLAIAIGIVALGVFFLMGKRRISRLIIIGLVAAATSGFAMSVNYIFNNDKFVKDYQRQRVNALLGKIDKNDKKARKGILYNVDQSKIAIGSGGIIGKGYLNGTQTKYKFVPEQDTDFIFCTVGEEWGFVGSTLVLGLFIFLILRILHLAERQRSPFTRVYAYCCAAIFFFHVLVNVGMTLGLMPVIGIPLPFFSYGGSSLLAFSILLFILIRLDAYRKQSL